MKVTKEMTFDCAHMLSGYQGKCQNLHGHTYKVQVTIEGQVKDDFIIDFVDLKKIMTKTIMDNFDHKVIISASNCRNREETELLQWVEKYGMDLYIVSQGRTTCENLVKEIQDLVFIELTKINFTANVEVRLWETPTSFCEVGKND